MARAIAIACVAAMAGLAVLDLTVGDRTLAGETLTIWPPELWSVAALCVASLVGLADRRGAVAVVATAVVFVGVTGEWRSLFRVGVSATSPDAGTIRLVTWNVARSPDLGALASVAPDICLFQESAPVAEQAAASPFWNGFRWAPTLDPAIFSRFPVETVPSSSVGPWAPPPLAIVSVPGGKRILLANVRLVLPGIVMKIASPSDSIDLQAAHAARIGQYRRLADEVGRIRAEHGGLPVILCGDFNVPASARSLDALAPFTDVWPEVGRGWGATMGADLPVSRIDQCWVSDGVAPVRAWVERGRGSDHRMLVVDLAVR